MSSTIGQLRGGRPLAGFVVLLTGHLLTDLVHLVDCLALSPSRELPLRP
ncbi:hypothetical protein AB0L68_10420 [Streptomyces sp. NPDC052164]